MPKGKTKLKGLEVKKVDFVDEGANQYADITLTKRREEGDSFFKGLISYLKKYISISPEAEAEAIGTVEKGGSQTFDEKMGERSLDRIRDEMWNVCYALQGSLLSILDDEELDSDAKKKAMNQSVAEFSQAAEDFIASWSQGTMANIAKGIWEISDLSYRELEAMKKRLEVMIQKGTLVIGGQENNHEGGNDMKIDKSKMLPEDVAIFERMAKAYGWQDDETVAGTALGGPENQPGQGEGVSPGADDGGQAGVEKGLHPLVQAEIEALRKAREALEDRSLLEVAKKYEVIGKKAEDLLPVFKSMKAAGDESYANYIAALDELVSMQESSGLFAEIGKSGRGSTGTTTEVEAFEKARAKATEIRKSRPELSEEAAIVMAVEQDPELWTALQ